MLTGGLYLSELESQELFLKEYATFRRRVKEFNVWADVPITSIP